MTTTPTTYTTRQKQTLIGLLSAMHVEMGSARKIAIMLSMSGTAREPSDRERAQLQAAAARMEYARLALSLAASEAQGDPAFALVQRVIERTRPDNPRAWGREAIFWPVFYAPISNAADIAESISEDIGWALDALHKVG
jgi:hypothetical protein